MRGAGGAVREGVHLLHVAVAHEDEADELFTRAQIGFHVFTLMKQRKLKQREIGRLLSIAQPEVSHLMNGHYSRFTADKLLDFLRRLYQTVTIHIRPHRPGKPYQEVHFAA